MKTKYKKRKNKIYLKRIITCTILSMLLFVFTYIIINTNILEPKVNELTTSYISYINNKTDMLKINNIKKMNDKIGKSILNNSYIEIEVNGKKNKDYMIVLYKHNNIDNKYIKYYINKIETLDNKEVTEDNGIIIYKGKINNDTKTIRMWIDKKYKDKVNDSLYEIKINEG